MKGFNDMTTKAKKPATKPKTFKEAAATITHSDIAQEVELFFSTMKPNGRPKAIVRKGLTAEQVLRAQASRLIARADAIRAVSSFLDILQAEGRDIARESIQLNGSTRNLERIAVAMGACRLETKSDVLADCCAAFCSA